LQEPAAALFLQAVAVATDGDHVAVVEKPIENSGCHHGIAEHGPPFSDTAIAGEQNRASLVTTTDELKEKMRGVGFERQVAQLVDDQQLGFGKLGQALLQPALAVALGELGDDVVAATNCTECPATMASRPSATARCVLPTPGGTASYCRVSGI
jgi:hypothetical protein